MDKKVLIVGVVLIVIQMTRAQPPNLAALLGLEGFGNLLGNMGGGGGGGQQQSSGSASCPYTPHADRKKFNWNVNGRNHVQDCPPGTMYVQSKCSCDNVPQGATANGPMPGSNPRLESSPGGGANSNPMIAALMSQLDAAFGGPSRAPRPSPRNNSPMNTNELNSIRHKITSGIRPDQSGGGNNNKPLRKPTPSPSRDVQYNLGPETGPTSVVDPSILPDARPPQVVKVLKADNSAPKTPRNYPPKSNANKNKLPLSVQQMVERAKMPPTKRPMAKTTPSRKRPTSNRPTRITPAKRQYPPTKSPSMDLGMKLPPGGIPKDVLHLLQKSVKPPPRGRERVNSNRNRNLNAKRQQANTARKANPKQQPAKPQPTKAPRRTAVNNKTPGPRRDRLAEMMAQMNRRRNQQRNTGNQSNGPRNDPLAALLGSMNQAPREPSRGSNRPQTRNQNNGLNRALPKPSGGPPGGDPMAALMASLGGLGGGGPNIPAGGPAGIGAGAGGNANSLPAVMATLNGGTPSSNDLALLAGLSSGGGAGLLRAPGSTSYLDMTNFFNAQGLMQGAAGGLSGMNNLDYLKLHTLDRHEVIDMGDLTPAGLLAANSHFANINVPPYIPSGSSALAMAALNNAARGNRGNNAPPAIFG